jgi:phosphoglycolate phosphatase-like HAD superfamily hydrolase
MATTTAAAAAQGGDAPTAPSAAPPPPKKKRVLRGVVFDMDGCVALSEIDFKEMRRRINAPPGTDILEHVAAMPTEREREEALKAIAEVEHAAIRGMRLAPGALELARALDARRVPRALVTRNVLRNLHHFHALHWIPGGVEQEGRAGGGGGGGGGGAAGGSNGNDAPFPIFHPAITRECGLRHKPHPDALEHIAKAWGLASTRDLVMIGDSAFDDVASGRRAGAVTVLIDAQGEYDDEWEEAEEEEEDDERAAAAAGGGGGAAAASPPARRGERRGDSGKSGRYLVGERRPHHKVQSLHGVREVLLGEQSPYELVPMAEEAWERRRQEMVEAAEAAHAAVAADAGTWQALE